MSKKESEEEFENLFIDRFYGCKVIDTGKRHHLVLHNKQPEDIPPGEYIMMSKEGFEALLSSAPDNAKVCVMVRGLSEFLPEKIRIYDRDYYCTGRVFCNDRVANVRYETIDNFLGGSVQNEKDENEQDG